MKRKRKERMKKKTLQLLSQQYNASFVLQELDRSTRRQRGAWCVVRGRALSEGAFSCPVPRHPSPATELTADLLRQAPHHTPGSLALHSTSAALYFSPFVVTRKLGMKPLFLVVVPGGQEAYRQSCTGTANHWHAFAALPDPHLTLALV